MIPLSILPNPSPNFYRGGGKSVKFSFDLQYHSSSRNETKYIYTKVRRFSASMMEFCSLNLEQFGPAFSEEESLKVRILKKWLNRQ